MGKQTWKPGNMVYPLPAVMVSCADKKTGVECGQGKISINSKK